MWAKTIGDLASGWFSPRRTTVRRGTDQPLRAELYSAEQMRGYGRVLAAAHKVGVPRRRVRLLARLAQNEAVLIDTCALLTAATKAGRPIMPAGEWLLDNFYLVEDHIRTARSHLPRRYSAELPALVAGTSSGFPRVYDIALEVISHGDGQVDLDSLTKFIDAYQISSPLTLGELWAIPIMLRLALIENLRRVADRIAETRVARNTANFWAEQMDSVIHRDPKSLVLVIADMARSDLPTSSAFIAELARLLQGQNAAVALALTWVEQWLAESGLTIKQMVQDEGQHQAADQVSIANTIGSLRFLTVTNWREFVEAVSTVEHTLRKDPASAYAFMDFGTRDVYRHAVEKIAKENGIAQQRVAEMAVELATSSGGTSPQDTARSHVGFYLVGDGVPVLASAAGSAARAVSAADAAVRRFGIYAGAVVALTAALALPLVVLALKSAAPEWAVIVCGLVAMIAASQVAVQLVNWVATLLVSPRPLGRMDYRNGVPATARTLVAVPTLLTGADGVAKMVEDLEIRYLGNCDPNIRFALLTDFRDAGEATVAADSALLEAAARHIAQLNAKYAGGNGDSFFLFHRARRFNARDRVWMGFERKRGKLADLNAYLRGDRDGRFGHVEGDTTALADVRYVLTLDSDTRLPRDAARELIATMMHPLNRPRFDAHAGRITAGYGILQPRIAAGHPGAAWSMYARLHSDEIGIDPYTRLVSDVYQDLFGEGSFVGKGIYDIDAFERALADRFPTDRVLSHDLLEGLYARSGVASDTQLVEDNPTSYLVDMRRRHRWIRGDWQIASWLFRTAPGAAGAARPSSLSWLSQWKIFDNLRRSLVPIALVALLSWGWLSPWPVFWSVVVLALLALPTFITSAKELGQKSGDMLLGQHVRATLRSTAKKFAQTLIAVACLPFEAWLSADAIVRTSIRILVTHRHLLQWTSASDTERANDSRLLATYRSMWIAPAFAALMAGAIGRLSPMGLAAAAPFLICWMLAPALAWQLSRPRPARTLLLDDKQKRFLRLISRRTWAYFETFVNANDNWLPPDNFQEGAGGKVAHRTSPTNIGLAMLADLAACDFGYLSARQLLTRIGNTLASLQKLERYRGHLLNWYDTATLLPLLPRYVSTVDSGNLVGHLFTLRGGIASLGQRRILDSVRLDGFGTTLQALESVPDDHASNQTHALQQAYQFEAARPATTVATGRRSAERLLKSIDDVEGVIGQLASQEANFWFYSLRGHCVEAIAELDYFAPWGTLAPVPEQLPWLADIVRNPAIAEIAAFATTLSPRLAALEADADPALGAWLRDFAAAVSRGSVNASEHLLVADGLDRSLAEFCLVDYEFLYDATRHLLAIGYNVTEQRRDPGFYDLLASETRLCNFVAVAQGRLPQDSWFALGRLLTHAAGEPILLSWSGSMFEYLMPLLVMPTYEGTLLDQTARTAVKRQIEYGHQRGVPWGISESGYNAVDGASNYQYRAFGVPGLGLQRGLGEDLVVAPYASALALLIDPIAACRNLQRLSADGYVGRYGFYEAIDFTPSRLQRGESRAIVQSFMAHHEAMTLLAVSSVLLDRPMQRRFAGAPFLQATLPLLHERVPTARALYSKSPQLVDLRRAPEAVEPTVRIFSNPITTRVAVQVLSNGRYHAMVTNAGSGFSRWQDLNVTRWREDGTRDPWGTFFYIRDRDAGQTWSPAFAPTGVQADSFEASFTESKVEFRRRDGDFDTQMEIVVSPEDDIELRRIRITNRGRSPCSLDVTSYAEVVLASGPADALHTSFSNLFVQTEIVAAAGAIVCSRRPRSDSETVPNMFHMMAVHGGIAESTSYETDRARFLGRGNDAGAPHALAQKEPLTGTDGAVLDPIVAIQHAFSIGSHETVTLDFVTGVASGRDACLALVQKYRDRRLADRAFEMAWTHSQVVLRQLNMTEANAQLYGRLAGAIVYANLLLRADGSAIAANRRTQAGLWGYSISGDLPIVLVQIKTPENIELVRQLVQAHAYLRLKGLAVDLVIWNEERGGYRQLLHDQIMGLIAASVDSAIIDRPGGIFVRATENISAEDRLLLQAVAHAIFSDTRGTLAEQMRRPMPPEAPIPRLAVTKDRQTGRDPPPRATRPALQFDNGLGGFSADGREYVIVTDRDKRTPAPWINVLANAHFGTVVSDAGAVYTWSENAQLFRLTPWENDAITDACGEAFYLRDEETGHVWSPTPFPVPGAGDYTVRHGFGYSVFEHTEDGIDTELSIFVSPDSAVKFTSLRVRNHSGRSRKLSATAYAEWVLGDLRARTAPHVVTEIDQASGALFARNAFHPDFSERVAFLDADDLTRTISGDRTEFIGRNGSLRNPLALTRARLSGKVGAALDPCAAIQIPFELAEGQSRDITFRMGVGVGPDDASRLVLKCRKSGTARAALAAVTEGWRKTLGAVQVTTPDTATNLLTNGWLVYQTLSCRLLGRTGFYQSGGAYGFRDQLQDAMALLHANPGIAREHLLRCAGKQFVEGDVQHWWHPPIGRGVRTRCSDDFLWLPLATTRYINLTGDWGILAEQRHFIEGRALRAEEESYYDMPIESSQRGTLYEHCVRAVRRGLAFGAHGLPLMGSGDWNDGMNNVGQHGRGESIWLGFFLYKVLVDFAKVADRHGDGEFARECTENAKRLQVNLERDGWDGGWYRRAYFDDGSPLGSASSVECQIDSVAQSWSVLSGAAPATRATPAMEAMGRRLIRRDVGLAQLLDPPFDGKGPDPGYIRGYLPGVRENGGQYTHAAVWAVMALAELKQPDAAWELLQMINPINHGTSPETVGVYRIEPYAVAADVYSMPPHVGRGGWSWYTGSAGWMYRMIVESILGLRREGDQLRIEPCVPSAWSNYSLRYRYGNTDYEIDVRRDPSVSSQQMLVDGTVWADPAVRLVDDGQPHRIGVLIPHAS